MKFKRYEWCDRHIAHGKLPLPKRFKHWVCNRFDDYVLRSCVGDADRP
jgi:hypothetical protein